MTDPLPDRTVLQFRLRSLFVATLVVAILSALVAPWVRDFTREQWGRLGALVGAALLFPSIYLGILIVRRWKVERKGGRLLLRTSVMPGQMWLRTAYPLVFLIGFTAFFFLVARNWVLKPGDLAWSFVPVLAFASLGNAGLSHLLLLSCTQLDSAPLEVREHGLILAAFRFVPWEMVCDHRWEGRRFSQLLLHLRHEVVALQIGRRDRAPLDRLLHEMEGRQARIEPTELAQPSRISSD